MIAFDPERCRRNVREAETTDLLDRVTAYRGELEPDAIPIIEEELHLRGVTATDRARHGVELGELLEPTGGYIPKCSFCPRPAVTQTPDWHRLWGVVPVFPRIVRSCVDHRERR